MSIVIAGAGVVNIGLVFTWLILLPVLATGLIIVAIVSARDEKAEDEELAGRWGRGTRRADDT
jgi:hypothetical protein